MLWIASLHPSPFHVTPIDLPIDLPRKEPFLTHQWQIHILYAGHHLCCTYKTSGSDRLTSLCLSLPLSALDLRQFTIAGCRGLFLCMFKNNLRSSGTSAFIWGDTCHLPTVSAVYLSLICVNVHCSALLGVQGCVAQWNASRVLSTVFSYLLIPIDFKLLHATINCKCYLYIVINWN